MSVSTKSFKNMVFWLSLPMAKSLYAPPAKVGAAASVGVWLGFPKGLSALVPNCFSGSEAACSQNDQDTSETKAGKAVF